MGNNLFLMRTISISNNDFDDICSLESGFFEGRKDEYRRKSCTRKLTPTINMVKTVFAN